MADLPLRGSEFFGDAVLDDVVPNTNSGLARGSIGLPQHDGNWWQVEPVPDCECVSWMSAMRNGPGRDSRIAGAVQDGFGQMLVLLHDDLRKSRPVLWSKEKDYPHMGPSDALGLQQGPWTSAEELVTYDKLSEADARIMKQNRLVRAEPGANPVGPPGQVGGPVQPLADPSDDRASAPLATKPMERLPGMGKKA